MAGPGSDGDLRRLLKLHRTEIAMAVDDVFPLLHGLADHDVVPEHVFKETLSRTEREGSHRAFHALLTWLLGRDTAALRDFWAVLFKDYNLERYSRLRPLRGAFPRGKKVELGRQRRGRRLSPSPTAPASHRPQGKRKAPEDRDKARAAHAKTLRAPSACVPCLPTAVGRGLPTPVSLSPAAALQAVAASVQRAVAVASGEVPVSRGAIEGILIKHVLDPSKYIPDQPPPPLFSPQIQEPPSSRVRVGDAGGKGKGHDRPYHSHPRLQPLRVAVTPCPLSWGQENEDECAACGDGGELICCDGCPRAFHLACLVPPLPHVPSGTWRCGSCVENVTEPGQLLEAVLPVERPSEILGEAAQNTQPGGAEGSVCSRCYSQIPTPRHCPAPSGDPRVVPQSTWDGILQWAFQTMARPLTETQGLLA
uniref:Autoimmune regulator n=1 Tax=Catharus ustulatus TaxID=91951 RepID=A0A8C3Y104_CATUS